MSECGGLDYFNRIRRSDWLPHGEGDDDEVDWHDESSESYDGSNSSNSEWSHLLSECTQPSSDEDLEFDKGGNFHTIEDDPSKEDPNFQIVRENSEVEDDAIYPDFDAIKRRRLNDGGFT